MAGQCFFARFVAVDRAWFVAEYVAVVETELALLPQLFTVFRDNDPCGYDTKAGKDAELKIHPRGTYSI